MHQWRGWKSGLVAIGEAPFVKITAIAILQPLLVLFINYSVPDSNFCIYLILAVTFVVSILLTNKSNRYNFLHSWTSLFISYCLIIFEVVAIPELKIKAVENVFLILFTIFSLFFLCLVSNTKTKCFDVSEFESGINKVLLDSSTNSICSTCQIKVKPKTYHCHICQSCIFNFNHHSYWLNCCITDAKIHYFIAGIFFGILALSFCSHLILTSVCYPSSKFGMLFPNNCSNVCYSIDSCTFFLCGLYCIPLAVTLFLKFIYYSWLIGCGGLLSDQEIQERIKRHRQYSKCNAFIQNWIQFFKKFKSINSDCNQVYKKLANL